jgi:flagellar FliL protein
MKKILLLCLFAMQLLSFTAVQASGGGGGEGKGGPLYSKLGTFTVNLQEISEFMQVDISVKMPNAELLQAIKTYHPFIRHELILLLSSQRSEQLASVAGKQKLLEQTKTTINKALKLDEKEGVSEVLFESFVIQQ